MLDVRRYFDADGHLAGDLIIDVHDELPAEAVMVDPARRDTSQEGEGRFETLLKPLVTDGKVEDIDLSARTAQTRCVEQFALLDDSIKRFMNPHEYPCGIERGLFAAATIWLSRQERTVRSMIRAEDAMRGSSPRANKKGASDARR